MRTWKNITKEHRDYILIKELYHCSPSELEKEEEAVLDLHFRMIQEERKREYIQQQREQQKAKMKALSNKKQ